MTEFFAQGELEQERGLPVSMLMDRATTNIAKAQVGFIDIIVMPSAAVSQTSPFFCPLSSFVILVLRVTSFQVWTPRHI